MIDYNGDEIKGGTKLIKQEWIDIYDRNMVHIGSMSRDKAHRLGHWHKTFQCWIVGKPQQVRSVLLQLRHESKSVFPGKLDKSAAGHLTAGETIEDGLRELEEELGIQVPFTELEDCGIVPLETPMESGGVDREFCHIFLHECDLSLNDFRVARGEVSGLFWVSLSDYCDLIYGRVNRVRAEGFVVQENGVEVAECREVHLDDLTPQSEQYYERLFTVFRRKGWL